MTVGENIKNIRKKKGLTQKELGKHCQPQIAESTIRKYELGLLKPKINTVDRIASALGVNIIDIMGFEYFDSITDLDELRKEISEAKHFEKLFISIYGKEEYDYFLQYSVLTEEASKKVKSYINDLFTNPKYRTDLSDQ